jgi:hypothetical protein
MVKLGVDDPHRALRIAASGDGLGLQSITELEQTEKDQHRDRREL